MLIYWIFWLSNTRKHTSYDRFVCTVRMENPNQARTNKNAHICLKITLPNNNLGSFHCSAVFVHENCTKHFVLNECKIAWRWLHLFDSLSKTWKTPELELGFPWNLDIHFSGFFATMSFKRAVNSIATIIFSTYVWLNQYNVLDWSFWLFFLYWI